MSTVDRWLLPEGIDEALPEQAEAMEKMRRSILDLYHSWGYELVMPPFIEYLESLLTGTGHDMDLQTFKLTDQLSGRMMGVRADMTPQVARIDAHRLKRDVPTRLCYLGTVLNTRPDGFAGTRSPLQVGAEIYGHDGMDSDIEVLSLMLETLRLTGVSAVHIDLGHVGIFRTLAEQAGLTEEQERTLFDMLQRKAATEISEFVAGLDVNDTLRQCLSELASLNGGADTFQRAHELMDSVEGLKSLIDDLKSFAEEISKLYPGIAVNMDLAELRGYAYHTGIVFAAYAPNQGKEIALGGRYDGIGQVFGQSRPATGFSTDLKTLLTLSDAQPPLAETKIFAPSDDDEALGAVINALRKEGQRVICALKGQTADAPSMGCTQQLVKRDDGWQLESL